MSETTARAISSKALLGELQKLVKRLLEDLRERSEEVAAVRDELTSAHQAALEAGATAESYTAWREAQLTQVAVAWVLASVFVRYLEDNGYLDAPLLAGSGDARRRVVDRISAYFRANPTHTDREYLQDVYSTVAALPGCHELLGQERNPLWRVGLSGDGARALLEYWQALDPQTGELLRPLECPDGDTRFLGDLYQDLSEEARSRFALLQTPEFVEEFILDRVLEPALLEFGLEQTTLIDPTCGSGHFLLGAFHRLLARWEKAEPGTNRRELARRALMAVHGVDVNPFAVAIARFRLLLAYLRACSIRRLAECPDVHPQVATGDSLLHGRLVDAKGQPMLEAWPPDVVAAGDHEDAVRMLRKSYAAVVGNPPYIVDRDKAHNAAVREMYFSAYRQFSLGVPFTERFFDLAHDGRSGRAGFVGMITTNSFMKREFGKKLIEEYLPGVDLTHVMDTSGAYIPGHGTPTVILVGRHRPPVASTVRAVMGIRGEPSTPDVPAQGRVWSSLVGMVDRVGSQNEFVSVSDVARETFGRHPWSIGGGGAAELKERIEDGADIRLSQLQPDIGRTTHTGEDEFFYRPPDALRRSGLYDLSARLVVGESVRDWCLAPNPLWSLLPYTQPEAERLISPLPTTLHRDLWPFRTNLRNRQDYGQTIEQRGLAWWEHSMFFPNRYRTPLSIAFAFVATHNHFVLDRGGKVFKQSAPIIKLPPEASEDDHLALLGLLNSSVACFWLKQVCHNKGATSDRGVLQDDPEKFRFEFDGTKLLQFPIPALSTGQRELLLGLTRALDAAGRELSGFSFQAETDRALKARADLARALAEARERRDHLRSRMARWQEELDWLCYELYGLLEQGSPSRSQVHRMSPESMEGLDPDLRPYRLHEHGQEPPAEDSLARHRLHSIKTESWGELLESPAHKRRWFRSAGAYNAENLDDSMLTEHALKAWLLDRLESPAYWPDLALTSCARLADRARRDEELVQVARLYAGADDVDLTRLVTELVTGEAVPTLPVLRYKSSGLAKRAEWEKTWELQRREDAGEKVGPIPVPPKYASADFAQPHFWRLRGKLDVPRERFTSYPRAERETDPSPVVGWAGWDHLEQAQALAACYLERKEQDGWTAERLMPLLAALAELLPWLKQWHNELHPEYNERMGDYYQAFVDQEARALGTTLEGVRGWTPPAAPARGRKRSK